jgi:hypothetical protein
VRAVAKRYLCVEVGDLMMLCRGAAVFAPAKVLVPTQWPPFGVDLARAKVILTELRPVFWSHYVRILNRR